LLSDSDTHLNDFAQRYWRKTAQISEALAELPAGMPAESQFRLMAEFFPTLCWMARADGYIVWYNRRWHDYCGTTPDAMEGWGWQSVHDPGELPRVMERWTASISAGAPFEMVFPLRGADGRFRPFLTRITPLRDATGQVVRWFGVNTEIGAQLQAEAALRDSQARYHVLTETMPQMVWSTLPDGYHDYYNAQWYAFTGVPIGSTDGEAWNGMFHPDDQERAWARWRHSLATGEPYEIEYRLRHHSGEYRWTLGRALPVRDAEGRILRWIGTCTDIDSAKRIAAQNELLGRELSHRIKNIFSVIAGLIRLAARRDPAAGPFARDLTTRIAALGRAHEFARPHSEDSKPEVGDTTLHGMLNELFIPYEAKSEGRIRLTGDNVPVDDRGATPIALIFHELATNAAKYGALSVPEGKVFIECKSESPDTLTIVWREEGGPPITDEPKRLGFGTQLATLSIEQQLGGTIRRTWRREGLVVEITTRPSRLTRVRPPDDRMP
jgi:PAS domain S-box-containing protein